MANGLDTSLSAAFRQRTLSLHSQAERSGIIQDMLRGRATRLGYALLLRNLLPAYQQLEAALQQRTLLPAFREVSNPAVYRTATIETDLRALFGPAWADALPLLPAGRRYADRIASIAGDDGFRLIAHVYTRYLGDLNGGQILKRLLTRSLGLESDALSFFDFPAIADLDGFKRDYRGAIDRAADDIREIEPVIEEAATAFELNILVSEAVRLDAAVEDSAHEPDGPDGPRPPLSAST
jgi:heme oxygenase